MSFRILRGQRNTCWFLERPAKGTHCLLPPKDQRLRIVTKDKLGRGGQGEISPPPVFYSLPHQTRNLTGPTAREPCTRLPWESLGLEPAIHVAALIIALTGINLPFRKVFTFLSLFNHVLLSYKQRQQTGPPSP